MEQVELVTLNQLVPKDHTYRKIEDLYPKEIIEGFLRDLAHIKGADGYGIERLFKCLFLQFLEDLSDRELERFLQENNAGKWFCGFGLATVTPGFSLFSKVRARIGASRLSLLFAAIRDSLKANGYMSEVFTFVDATHLIAKARLWKERDKVIKAKMEKLNNKTVSKVAHDKQARLGCKGKDKYWYGYKEHVSVDMPSGLINKVAVTPANVTDGDGLKNVCPNSGAVYADKGYCSKRAHRTARGKGAVLRSILKNNMKEKNRDLDRWISGIRSPYERVFSKRSKYVRYVGVAKNQFASTMHAIVFNMKRLIELPPPKGLTT